MRCLLISIFLLISPFARGQNIIPWDGTYQLQLSDFRSPTTQIGGTTVYSLFSGSSMDFSFYMSNAEFLFTKNFNSRVNCSFNRNLASLVAPDSLTAVDLLHFARYTFDLSELYARKFRKQLFDEKGAFSDVSFFKPIYEETQREFVERHTMAAKSTDLGRNGGHLNILHEEVLNEIKQLSDFCKTCKPPRKKK